MFLYRLNNIFVYRPHMDGVLYDLAHILCGD